MSSSFAPAVSIGNWTPFVKDVVKGKETADYVIGSEPGYKDPVTYCQKDFSATYRCGNSSMTKTINIPGEAFGKIASFDCSKEENTCASLRLTLGDDGNLVLTDAANKQIWTSNTNKIGLVVDKFNAKNGKYGRNYLLAGETLGLGEFIGSPSGNCYLMMDKTADGDGILSGNTLQLKYSVLNCSAEQYGEDESTNGLFSVANSAYDELAKTTQRVTPEVKKLQKTDNKLTQMTDDIDMTQNITDYSGIRKMRPIIKKHIQQLDAMDEDRQLFLVRYNYRRIAWATLAVFVLLAGIKMARSNM